MRIIETKEDAQLIKGCALILIGFITVIALAFHTRSAKASEEMAQYMQRRGEMQVDFVPAMEYTEQDVVLLAKIIQAESGADYLSDTLREYVGSVVINRVNDPRFPDNIYDVINAPGQYYPVMSGTFLAIEPDTRCLEIATELLEQGPTLPSQVVWQANFRQGTGTYAELEGMYFCY